MEGASHQKAHLNPSLEPRLRRINTRRIARRVQLHSTLAHDDARSLLPSLRRSIAHCCPHMSTRAAGLKILVLSRAVLRSRQQNRRDVSKDCSCIGFDRASEKGRGLRATYRVVAPQGPDGTPRAGNRDLLPVAAGQDPVTTGHRQLQSVEDSQIAACVQGQTSQVAMGMPCKGGRSSSGKAYCAIRFQP